MKTLFGKGSLNLIVRIGLFSLILTAGTFIALVSGETPGLALADLSGAPVRTMTTAAGNQVLYAALNGDLQSNSLYRSKDNGRTWQAVGTWPEATINTLATDPANNAVLYAGTSGGPLGTNNVWRSEDGGKTWHHFNLSLPASPTHEVPAVTAIVTDPNQPGVLYVGTDGQGVYRFTSGQLGYELVGGLSLPDAHIKDLVMAPDSRLYSLTNRGLFVTSGDAWQKVESIPETPISLAVAASQPQVLYAGTPSSGAYRSVDGGQTWQSISDGLGLAPGASLRVTALAVDETDSNHVVVSTAYSFGRQIAPGSIYESYQAGQRWTKVADIDSPVKELTISNGVILAATDEGLRHYGAPAEVSSQVKASNLESLANPSGTQILVLILTISLAGLVLLGRIEWITKLSRKLN